MYRAIESSRGARAARPARGSCPSAASPRLGPRPPALDEGLLSELHARPDLPAQVLARGQAPYARAVMSSPLVAIAGAAGKKVVITNILGQTVANTVVTSDNATIAAPAGVVVVAIEGEDAVKAIVK